MPVYPELGFHLSGPPMVTTEKTTYHCFTDLPVSTLLLSVLLSFYVHDYMQAIKSSSNL